MRGNRASDRAGAQRRLHLSDRCTGNDRRTVDPHPRRRRRPWRRIAGHPRRGAGTLCRSKKRARSRASVACKTRIETITGKLTSQRKLCTGSHNMTIQLDPTDLKLLDAIQQEIPLVERPFEVIAQKLDSTEFDVISRLTALKTGAKKVIRQISAIFDSRSLGYTSCLVAANVYASHIEQAVAPINAHPGVSHNYLRNHAYNIWYTVAVTPDSRLG